jgi:DNA-binding NarL/FixJ family response regulator
MDKIRILIADDHAIVRRGLRPLLETQSGWEVCGEAADGREAVALAEQLKPDVVVLDVAMPELDGVEAARQIKQRLPETEVLAFTGTDDVAVLHQLFAVGVLACILKMEADEQLIPAIKALCQHQPYLNSRTTQIVFTSYLRAGPPVETEVPGDLSPQERQIVQLLAEGKRNKEVAATLGLAVKTVEMHRARIMRKLGLASIGELVRFALRYRIIE